MRGSETAKIIGLSVLSAVVYGMIHDQVTARICVEYFTIGHPPVFDTEDPTLLGLGWGVIATWWVGLILGCALAAAARAGRWPRLDASELLRPLLFLLTIMGLLAAAAGVAGYLAATAGSVRLVGSLAARVPPDRHVAFLTNLWAHTASYGGGTMGGLALCLWTIRVRRSRVMMSCERHQSQKSDKT